jgi:hypothetical protein
MDVRMIDRNGHRFGAGISAVVLAISAVLDWRAAVPVMAAVLGIGAIFGLRYSPLGATYRFLKRSLKLKIPTVLEEEPPPRFAQLMGLIFLGISTVGFFALDNVPMGWSFALIVVGLQTLLATSGICVGCEVYLIGKRLGARSPA